MMRARVEIALAVIAGILTVVSILWPTWVESLFGMSPDAGSGETERWIALVFAAAAILFAVLARRDRRRAASRRDLATNTI